jgi:putative transposase
MARKHREEVEGGLFHVYARGVAKQSIFRDDDDRQAYLGLLAEVVRRKGWRCLAYCLMANHVHLVIETPLANLGSGMQLLHGKYARAFNDRHDRVGHLFQGRYGARRIASDAQLWVVLAYVAMNPVEAGIVARADEWPWSSYAAAVSRTVSPEWLDLRGLFSYLAADGAGGRERYRRLVSGAKALTETIAVRAPSLTLGSDPGSKDRPARWLGERPPGPV